jgi:hypothetical protein
MSTANKSHGKRIFNPPSTEKLPQHRQLTRIATSFLKVDEIRSSPLLRPDIFLQPATRYNISKCLPLSWHLPTPPSSSPMRVLRSPYEQPRACDGRKPPRQEDPADIGVFFLQADKLQTIIKAGGVDVEPIWTSLFAKVRPKPHR